MAYISDRQRVELVLLPMLAHGVVVAGAAEPDSAEAKEAKGHFCAAMKEALALADSRKQVSLFKRALRLHEEVTLPFRHEGGRVDKVGLILYNLLNWSIESGYLVLPEGTPMSKGLDLLLPGLEHSANETKLNASAVKAAGKMLKVLQEQGYFQGVSIQ